MDAKERNSIKPDVKPIPEPTKFEPYSYGGERHLSSPLAARSWPAFSRVGSLCQQKNLR